MRTLSQLALLDEVRKIVNGETIIDKVLLIQFHSNADIDKTRNAIKAFSGVVSVSPMDCDPHTKGAAFLNGELIRMEDHKELSEEFFFPFEYKDTPVAKCFLFFFRGTDQLLPEYIDYCKRLSMKSSLPIVYLVNDYSADLTNARNDSFFEHIDIPLETEDSNLIYKFKSMIRDNE